MSYGTMSPEARARAQAEYEEMQAQNRAAANACRYCKAARTRASNALWRRGKQWAQENPETYASMVKDAAEAMCSEHRSRSRLNFTTSPISETYWST